MSVNSVSESNAVMAILAVVLLVSAGCSTQDDKLPKGGTASDGTSKNGTPQPTPAQSDQGRLTWAVIESRIEKADAEGLKAIEAELQKLPLAAISPAGDIKFSGMIGDRYRELSMPELAVVHYHRAIAIPHSKQRQAAYGCANMWSVAMSSLLCHYDESNQQKKILTTLNKAKDHSDTFSFKAQYHEMQIQWRSILGDPAGAASYAEREMAELLKHLPNQPIGGELSSLISLVTTAIDVPSDTRIRWLETLGASAEKSVRQHHHSFDHFRNLLNVRRYCARIIAKRRADPTLLDRFASGLEEFAEIAIADIKSDSADDQQRRKVVRRIRDRFLAWLAKTKAEAAPSKMVGTAASRLSGVWVTEKTKTSLKELRGRVVVLDFWAIWCGPCVATFPKLNKLYRQFDRDQMEIIGITKAYGYKWDTEANSPTRSDLEGSTTGLVPDEAELTAVRRFTASHGLQFPQLVQDGSLSESYGVKILPTIVVIAPNGNVADVIVGAGKESEERLFEKVGKLIKATAEE